MFILTLALIFQMTTSQNCKVIKSNPSRHKSRDLQQTIERETTWESIRFHVDWSGLSDSDKKSFEKYIDAAFVYYSNVLKVHRIRSKQVWDDYLYSNEGYCDALIERFKQNIIKDTDMIVYIVSQDDSSQQYAGYSVGCGNDPQTLQPIASLISLNKAYNKIDNFSEDEIIMLIIHELAHSLGFSYDDMQAFQDSNGELYKIDELFTTVEKRGQSVVFLSTPNVKKRARAAFDCETLPGIELENQGGEVSALHHWDKRMVGTEFMGPQILINDAVYSDLTLALFEDSGWYKPDYSYSTPINFGYHKGCKFIDLKCIVDEKPTSEEFCAKSDRMYCDSTHLSYGYCYLYEYNFALEQQFQYFSDENFGGDAFSDYCPINERTYDCRSPFEPEEDYGERFCIDCRCFESTISKTDPSSELHASCYKVKCLDHSYEVTVGTIKKTCTEPGQQLVFEGFNGKLECLDFDRICYQVPCRNNCYGGKCKKGICENGGDQDYFEGESYPDGQDFSCNSSCDVISHSEHFTVCFGLSLWIIL